MSEVQPPPLVPAGTRLWVLGSGKVGHEVHCIGIARALGLEPDIRPVRPRLPFAWASPFGPVDPRDAPHRAGSAIAPPYPDIVFAAGRTTVPYLRRLKRETAGRIFTVFLQDPRTGPGTADMIWVPEHDRLRGPNVLTTLTSPHPLRPHVLAAARQAPDPRLAHLPGRRAALILGGNSAHHRFEPQDCAAIVRLALDLVASGYSLMVTPSRRTPETLVADLRSALSAAGAMPGKAFVWDGTGDNPYAQIIAHADALVVTADSVNMMGEAIATGRPVHVYEPTGGHPKIRSFLDRLVAAGWVRRWQGAVEDWTYDPVDATGIIAAEVARRYAAFRQSLPAG
jgi:mitochondrial fission protein ELM1